MRWLAVVLLAGCLSGAMEAAVSPWQSHHRIAISADGNPDADADDVGATPFSLAILAKAGLQDNLVHYDFNNFLEYKKIEPDDNRMWVSAMGAQARWGFEADVFFDAAIDPEGAVANLRRVINASTSADPLYLIVAGPMELIYRALEGADESAREHVRLVSHHDYNEYFKPRLWQRNWNDCWTLMGLNPVSPYGITRKTYHSINQEQFDEGVGFSWHTTHGNYGAVAKKEGHFSVPVYSLSAGDHWFWICGRSGGFRIDKIQFFKEGVAGFKSDAEPITPMVRVGD